MRIGELSRRSGVPVPTIKYYVREGLLPAGERTKANQTDYGEDQLRRLRLVRALIEIGGVSVRNAQHLLAHLDDPGTDPLDGIGKAQYALLGFGRDPAPPGVVDALIERKGWTVGPRNPARAVLAEALSAAEQLGLGDLGPQLDRYADTAADLARSDLDLILAATLDESAERVVSWTVLGDRILSALRRLAQEHEARSRLTPPTPHT